MKRLLPVFVLVLALAPLAAAAEGSPDAAARILVAEFSNDVNPVTQDYLTGAIDRAEDEGYEALVIEMDTPGGLGSSMREIVKAILAAEVPVIVYVAPGGASADSAGAVIAMASDVLAMAPQTNIGSSTPISATGEDLNEDLRKKVVNDAAAYIRELAVEHGRDGDTAEDMVRDALNLGARDALRRDVADRIAPDLQTLLADLDGTRTAPPKRIELDTANARVERIEMSGWKKVLDLLIDPNIIALMLSIGLIGIVVELWNPGLVFPGTVGAVSLIVGLYGLQVLPISAAGLLLMLVAAGFFVAELFIPSHGALTVGGGVCFVIGALMLFDPAGPAYQVSLPVALAIAGTMGAFMLFAVAKIAQVRRRPVEVDVLRVVGAQGRVRRPGYVFVNGELWRARQVEGETLREGELVEVAAVDGLELEVRRVDEPAVGSTA